MDCLFCEIVKGNIPSYKVYEDDYTFAFLDINPKSFGHTIVIPKTHCIDFNDFSFDANYFLSLQKISQHLKTKLNYDGINVLNNTGVIAGQEVFHMHFHLIPIYDTPIEGGTFEQVMDLLNN